MSSLSDAMSFEDVALAEVPVSVGDKSYILREASGETAALWRNSQVKATKLGPDGRPIGFENLADSEAYLVHLCLWDGKQNVPLMTVRKWPHRIVRVLFERAKRISGLHEEQPKHVLEAQVKDLQAQISAIDNGKPSPVEAELGNEQQPLTAGSG